MAYLVFDLETENHTIRKRLGNPFDPKNYVVARGWKKQGDPRCSYEYFSEPSPSTLEISKDVTLLVGHNIKYDLLYEMSLSNQSLRDFFKRGGRIWCGQYAEYLLNGQQRSSQMVSMDQIIEKYGGRKKIDEVKLLWEEGYLTSEIPKDLLVDYLVGTEEEGRNSGDIGNTELIFLGQLKEAKEKGMVKTIMARMDGLCATTEMEFNGVYVDKKVARERLVELTNEMSEVKAKLAEYTKDIPKELGFNWGSGNHVSAILFGGCIKYQQSAPYMDEKTGELARLKAKAKWPLFGGKPVDPEKCSGEPVFGTYKNAYYGQDEYASGKQKGMPKFRNVDVPGKIKTKIQDFYHDLPGFVKPLEEWETKNTDGAGNPVYSTGKETIEVLEAKAEHDNSLPFLTWFTRYTFLSKEIGTYYVAKNSQGKIKGMLTCVDPATSIIHHKLNESTTVTTRLSSSDPNLQNLSRKDKSRVKEQFRSRYGEDGLCLEADYSQLEVVVQQVLSGDKQLAKDLRDGVDFHCKRVSAWKGISYEEALARCKDEDHPLYAEWSPIRTAAKVFSFQRAYGAGAAKIAYTTGMDVEDVQSLIAAEEKLYPGIPDFNEDVKLVVTEDAEPFKQHWSGGGFSVYRRGTWIAPTGTRYTFQSKDAPAWLKKKLRRQGNTVTDTFSPTEMKNYPVQGTAGEFVVTILGLLWRRFVETDNYGGKALFVNTVHDCIWIDMHKDVVHEVAADVRRIMESIPGYFNKMYGMHIGVPFPVDIEIGKDMYDMHSYNKDTDYG